MGERGKQGVQGPSGPQGIEGPEGVGAIGETGERGERGKTGHWPRQIAGSFLAVTIMVGLLMMAMAWIMYQNRQLAKQGKEAHDAICTLKDDYRRRIDTSSQWLEQHPEGVPGIEPSVIQNSISNQIATLRALDDVDCDNDPQTIAAGVGYQAVGIMMELDEGSWGWSCRWWQDDPFGGPPWWYWWSDDSGWGGPCVTP